MSGTGTTAKLLVKPWKLVNPYEVSVTMNLKRRFAILAVPAVLAMGGGALAVHAASTPTPSPASSESESATEAPEAPTNAAPKAPAGAAGEVETADPAGDVQSGHADPPGEVDHQATGEE
jgi:hypothetical protein